MMDRLEKASGLKAITLQEAKLLLKDDDDLITAVYDYWLNKRLRLQQALIPSVRSDRIFSSTTNDPYIAFRKRTEKMQTRKNRKNDETSFEKMLKLRRDLGKAISLVDMVKRREKVKRESLHLNIELHEKRYELEDFSGDVIKEIQYEARNERLQQNVFTQLTNHNSMMHHDYSCDQSSTNRWIKAPVSSISLNTETSEAKKEKRPYKKRKKQTTAATTSRVSFPAQKETNLSMDKGTSSYLPSTLPQTNVEPLNDNFTDFQDNTIDNNFTFCRKPFVHYHKPRSRDDEEKVKKNKVANPSLFHPTSISHPSKKFIGLARRRIGRGGRIWLDRIAVAPMQDPDMSGNTKDKLLYNDGLESRSDDPFKDLRHYGPSTSDSDEMIGSNLVTTPVIGSSFTPNFATASVIDQKRSQYSSSGEGVASSFFISAQVLDGLDEGSVTEFKVSLPAQPASQCEYLEHLNDTQRNDDNLESRLFSQCESKSNQLIQYDSGFSELMSQESEKTTLNCGINRHSSHLSFHTQPSSSFNTFDVSAPPPLSRTASVPTQANFNCVKSPLHRVSSGCKSFRYDPARHHVKSIFSLGANNSLNKLSNSSFLPRSASLENLTNFEGGPNVERVSSPPVGPSAIKSQRHLSCNINDVLRVVSSENSRSPTGENSFSTNSRSLPGFRELVSGTFPSIESNFGSSRQIFQEKQKLPQHSSLSTAVKQQGLISTALKQHASMSTTTAVIQNSSIKYSNSSILVPKKCKPPWTNSESLNIVSNDAISSLISNGPSAKTFEKLKNKTRFALPET